MHERAEVSDKERETARTVRDWLTERDIEVVAEKVGGHGLVARVRGGRDGPGRLFRADLDALPIKKGRTDDDQDRGHAHHACGHDGHMAMLAGALVALQANQRDWAGTVYGLFQPSEETGRGGARVIRDETFPTEFARAYGIHNLPGVAMGTVRCRAGPMACGSTGLELRFYGSTAHAAHPEAGHNPIPAIAELVPAITRVADDLDDAWGLITPIQVSAGKVAYGTAAGRGVARFTLRADSNDGLDTMIQRALRAAEEVAEKHGLRLKHQKVDTFPATLNDETAVGVVERAARRAGLTYDEPQQPQRWSEDFGHFTGRWPGALIGLGSGTDQPELHTPDYEFPDELIPRGIALWHALAQEDDHDDRGAT